MYLSVDRIEEGYAICEDEIGNILKINLKLLPENIKESDIIRSQDGKYYIEKTRTRKIKNRNLNLFNKITKIFLTSL